MCYCTELNEITLLNKNRQMSVLRQTLPREQDDIYFGHGGTLLPNKPQS